MSELKDPLQQLNARLDELIPESVCLTFLFLALSYHHFAVLKNAELFHTENIQLAVYLRKASLTFFLYTSCVHLLLLSPRATLIWQKQGRLRNKFHLFPLT
jgi:hypothetical protein